MATCDVCGEYENLPYQCKRCGQTFCAEHRLPENHDCPGLAEWDDPGGVFDSGFDESVEGGAAGGTGDAGGASAGVVDRVKGRIDRETGTGGVVGYFRNNATYAILLAMWVTFVAQWIALFVGGPALHQTLFILHTNALGNVWTWVTSVLSHSPGVLFHIIGNSIVILFFGPLVERAVGSKKFVAFFFASGILAGLGHVLFAVGMGASTGVLGASGAGFAILGVLTVWRPNMQVLLFFVIPMKIKYLTWGIALVSAVLVVQSVQAGGAGSAGNIAHLAHLIGFAIGLAFGKRNEGLARSAGGMGGVSMGGPRGPRGPGGPGGPGGRF